jgi:hypothetical protein
MTTLLHPDCMLGQATAAKVQGRTTATLEAIIDQILDGFGTAYRMTFC